MTEGEDDTDGLVRRVERSLACKPNLRAALSRLGTSGRARVHGLALSEGGKVRRGALVRKGGFHVALLFGEATSVVCVPEGSFDRDVAQDAESVFRYGTHGDLAVRNVDMRRICDRVAYLPPLATETVEAIEGLHDDDVVVDVDGRLSAAAHRATLARVVERMLEPLPRARRDLVAHLLRGGRDLDPALALAVHVATGVARPDWVLQAIRAAPLLEALVWPTHAPSRPHEAAARFRDMLADLSSGRSRLSVVREFAGLPDDAPPVLVRSVANLPHDMGSIKDAVEALGRFHSDNPRHRHLEPDEARNAADATVSRHPAIVRALLTTDGRVGAFPDGMRDALASLRVSLESIDRWTRSSHVRVHDAVDGIAFPPGRRHAGLVRIDREWHARVGRHERALLALREEALSAGVSLPEGELPQVLRHPVDIDGVLVTPLLTRVDYVREGEEMRHCVGSYARQAWGAGLLGFSLRGPSGTRTTLTMRVGESGILTDVEHRAVANCHPPMRHAGVADILARRILADTAAMATLLAVRKQRRQVDPDAAGLPVGAPDDLVARYKETHFANVATWLTPSEVAPGLDAWWDTVVDRFGHRSRLW